MSDEGVALLAEGRYRELVRATRRYPGSTGSTLTTRGGVRVSASDIRDVSLAAGGGEGLFTLGAAVWE